MRERMLGRMRSRTRRPPRPARKPSAGQGHPRRNASPLWVFSRWIFPRQAPVRRGPIPRASVRRNASGASEGPARSPAPARRESPGLSIPDRSARARAPSPLPPLFLLLFLFLISWQKNFDLLLYAAEPRFVAICERRVIRQCKLARIPDHTQFLVRKKALGFYQPGTGGEVSFCTRIVLYKVVSHMHTIAVKIPFPCYEISALFPKPPGQHRVPEICEDFVAALQPDCFQCGSACKDRHIFSDLRSDLYHSLKRRICVYSPDRLRRETNHTVAINVTEQLTVPFDVEYPAFRHLRIQSFAQELPLHLSQKSLFLCCLFFAHIHHLQSQRPF